MNAINASYLLAHAFELRLLVAVIALTATYATIEIALFIGRTVKQLLAKANSIATADVSTGAYSAAGAR